MALGRWRRHIVNSDNLYSVPPWDRPTNFVNLGSLYRRAPKSRGGWAYFENGSVFISTGNDLDHESLESELKLFQHFVDGPPPTLKRVAEDDPSRRRLMISPISIQYRKDRALTVWARTARAGQNATDEPFERVDMDLDKSGSYPIFSNFRESQEKVHFGVMKSIQRSLGTFRGTLVDGVLQPNVRLDNALPFSHEVISRNAKDGINSKNHVLEAEREPSVGVETTFKLWKETRQDENMLNEEAATSEREGELDLIKTALTQREMAIAVQEGDLHVRQQTLKREEVQLKRREMAVAAQKGNLRVRQQILKREEVQLKRTEEGLRAASERFMKLKRVAFNQKEASINAKERELQQSEEILKWKHKAFTLHQQLSKLSSRRKNPSPHLEPDSETEVPTSPPDLAQRPQSSIARDFPGSNQDVFTFLENNPPEPLARLRTRIQLPSKGRFPS